MICCPSCEGECLVLTKVRTMPCLEPFGAPLESHVIRYSIYNQHNCFVADPCLCACSQAELECP